ncbi:dynactin subunit 2 isoform X2 [Brachionus plicatilis]|uniref:Dynactin subunit 2 isoform X2 n=1 Tax=Brachionus plicatilis TaxID=10195 RepID=A0A3M7RI45_BRAPC|nr:dynactin subunit 2 isoform X2 [Brachionus plicatilis]
MDKYANLPGIAKNEPDLYETPNVVSNSNQEVLQDDSNSVEKILISQKEAHEKFNKHSLNSDFVDFSDTISNRRKFGYLIEPESFEWNQDPEESPVQKLKRLEKELAELKVELNQVETLTSADEEKKKNLNFDPINLTKHVESLQKEIKNLHLQSIGSKSDITFLDNKAKKQYMVDQLNSLKQVLGQNSDSKASKNPDLLKHDTSIVFKLFADLENSDINKAKKINELNGRLENLEKIFGPGNAAVNETQIAKLCNGLENKSILGLVENLKTKMSLLDAERLDKVDNKLQILLQRVNQLNEKKGLVEDQEKLNRVNELFQMMSSWKDVSSTVPVLVERLSSLSELHQKALQFTSILSRLDAEQSSLTESIQTSSSTLNDLKNKFEQNLDSIKTNFENLNQRVLSIEGKQ